MRRRDKRPVTESTTYQATVLGISALVIIIALLLTIHLFQSAVNQSGNVSVGAKALTQVLGAAAPRAPAASQLPGVVGTPTPVATLPGIPAPAVTPTVGSTPEPTPAITSTPDLSVYDPDRATTLLAQAQTSFDKQSSNFVANVKLAAQRINGKEVAPGATLSFNDLAGPYQPSNGYKQVDAIFGDHTDEVPTVAGGITQVSTTLFQAAFWSGLKIVERHPHRYWLNRFNAGSTGQKGLDAEVSYPLHDLSVQNTTGDWIRIQASAQSNSVSVAIYGADPGWSVNPEIGTPTKVVQPKPTETVRIDPSLSPGQQFTVFGGSAGFNVNIQRTVVDKEGNTIDRYGLAEHYQAMPAIIALGPTPTATATATATPTPTSTPLAQATPAVPTGSGGGSSPTHLAGLNPSAFVLPNGQIRTPNLVGLPEAEAQQVITAVGLMTTYANYQGPGDVPAAALNAVPVGDVLSQNPSPGAAVPRGTTVYIAVRKQ